MSRSALAASPDQQSSGLRRVPERLGRTIWRGQVEANAVGGHVLPASEDDRARGRKPAARPIDTGDLSAGHLSRAALAAELTCGFDEKEDAPHPGMAMRQTPAVGVGRKAAGETQRTVGHEWTALPLLAEAEAFDGEEHHRGERVVELADVDVVRRHPGPSERLAS